MGLDDQVHQLNTTLVRTVKEALQGLPVLVAGDMSTTGLIPEPFGETEFVQLVNLYASRPAPWRKRGRTYWWWRTDELPV